MPTVTCPSGHRLQVPDRQIGRTIICPTCDASFVAEAGGGAFEFGEEQGGSSRGVPPLPGGGRAPQEPSQLATQLNNFVGKPLMFVGLVLAVLGRGCDATSMRAVTRTHGLYSQAREAVDLEWDLKQAVLAQEIEQNQRARTKLDQERFKPAAPGDDIAKRQEEFKKRSDKLLKEKESLDKKAEQQRSDRSEELIKKESGDWKPLRTAALQASNDHRMASYYYEWVFIFGTVVLVLGLLTVAFTGQGAERWISYIIIAIISFSVYVGGAAWIESIATSTQGMQQRSLPPLDRGGGRFPR